MTGQDKNEDIMEALSIDENKKPYFPYMVFYICLAIIKKNNFDLTKDISQKNHFVKYLKYINRHYKGLGRSGLMIEQVGYMKNGSRYLRIPEFFGLNRETTLPNISGSPKDNDSQEFCEQFLANWFDDLLSYFNRAPGLKKEMLKHMK